uniref:HEAT repeat-containing protein 5B n=1 Tax=Meloidogyne hapla TaxID=6305 RepID=A0A1I8B3B7_MELHA
MEQAQSLLLNEIAFVRCPDPQKNIFIYEWLKYLDRILTLTKKSDLKNCQQKLGEQLNARIVPNGCSFPTRLLLGRCIAKLFSVADTSHLFETINLCNDALKDPSVLLQVKLTALSVIGEMFEYLGRMVGRSYEETFQALAKWLKSAESTARIEILITISKMLHGLGSGTFPIFKDIYKCLARALFDRVMAVRVAAANCFACIVEIPDSPLFIQHDLESICTLCIKSLHVSNADLRLAIANVFAKLASCALKTNNRFGSSRQRAVTPTSSKTQQQQNPSPAKSSTVPFDVLLRCLFNGMLRGGVGGFLKNAKTATGIRATVGQRETRIGISEAYVAIARELGTRWLKRNLQLWCEHLLELACKSSISIGSATSSASSFSHSNDQLLTIRRCLHFIFRSTIGALLSEPDQISACKRLGIILAEYNNCFDCTMDSSKEEERVLTSEVHASANSSVVCLIEIGCIALQVDTAISTVFVEASGVLEPIFACLLHPIQSVRIAASFCLKCIVTAIPSLTTPLVDRCLNRLEYMKKSPEAINGFSLCLAALLAQCRHSQLGIPFAKCRQVFTLAEELIKSSTQTPRLMLRKVQAGWILIAAILSLGPAFARPILPRLLTLWRISFPRSAEETKTERGCGDVGSWEATLEARAGALASMSIFALSCPEMVNDELAKRLIVPIETSLSTMSMVADLLLLYGVRIRPVIQLLHLRLFSLLCRLPVARFESAINPLLKEIVAEITLSDNAQTTQKNSLCAPCYSCAGQTFLYVGFDRGIEQESYLEIELNPLQTLLPGSLDFDPLQLVKWWPEPQPLPTATLDSAIHLFSKIFPVISARCKLQLLQHFGEQLKTCQKHIARAQALQINILTSLCLAAECIGKRRQGGGKLDDAELQKAYADLVLPFLGSNSLLIKFLAAETLGRLAQAVATPQFVATNAQYCFEKIRSLKDESSRQGYTLAIGSLHRYMGSLGSGQHLNTAIGILLSLAQDTNNCSSIKQWAIISLSLIASTGGGMFCPYAEPVRNLCLQLLMNTQHLSTEIVRAVAKLIFSLITAAGPELNLTPSTSNGNNGEYARNSFLTICSMLIQFDDPFVKADATACYQHLHLFVPRFLDISQLVLIICEFLYSPIFILRKSAIACLRQLLQRESHEVREHAKPLMSSGLLIENDLDERKWGKGSNSRVFVLPEYGLEGALFQIMDTETDPELREHIKQSILFLLQTTSSELLGFWLLLCKEILGSSQLNQDNLRSTICVTLDDGKEENEDDDDNLHGNAPSSSDSRIRSAEILIHPRWPTRCFAFEIVQRLLALCDTERAHLDLALAKELKQMDIEDGEGGATSENFHLQLAGLSCLQNIISKFSKVAEPEFPGHVLLEQFQAQIGAALRPAFSPETPANVIALACQVASTWLCSGVARDLNDLRRVHQLLASSLDKLPKNESDVEKIEQKNSLPSSPPVSIQLYNESNATLEQLSILRAWAKVYICAIEQWTHIREESLSATDFVQKNDALLCLVEPSLDILVKHWFDVLKDFAILSMPHNLLESFNEYGFHGGTFFTADSIENCKEHYYTSWPLILLACSVWIRYGQNLQSPKNYEIKEMSNFHLIIGICMDFLCNNSKREDEGPIQLCLSSMEHLLECEKLQLELMTDLRMPIELLNVLYKLILTLDSMQIHLLCVKIITSILRAAKLVMEANKKEENHQNNREIVNGHHFSSNKTFMGGEGVNGIFNTSNSLVFAFLETIMCVLSRQDELIHSTLDLLSQLTSLCCIEGILVILPSLLNFLFGVLRECSSQEDENQQQLSQQSKAISSAILVNIF